MCRRDLRKSGISGFQQFPTTYVPTVKSTQAAPGLHFINVLRAAFTPADPESVTIQLSCQYLFKLLESVDVKAARER